MVVTVRTLILTVILTATAVFNSPAAPAADDPGDAVRAAIAQVRSSVVRIRIVGYPDRAGKIATRVTTGVVVSDAGEVVSSSFGFGGNAAAVFVRTASGERFAAEVVATDHVRKLVLLRTDATGVTPPQWAEEVPPVGAWAIAAGRFYPAPDPSAALGIISAHNRVHGLAIQTDAKVSPVNYGGPLLTMNGTVAGILVPLAPGNDTAGVTAGVGWYDSGIGFAVPARDVADSVRRLRSGEDRRHGLLGIRPATQNPLSADVVVKTVQPGSPADAIGMQAGDRILAVDDRPMERIGQLQSALRSSWAGDSIRLKLQRNEQELTVEATLAEELPAPERGWLGIVPLEAVDTNDTESDERLIRVGILSGSAAAEAGLPNPCWISSVDGEELQTVTDLRRLLSRLMAGTELEITFSPTERAAETRTVSVTAGVKSLDERWQLLSEVAAMRESVVPETLPEWTQSVADLKEDRHVWILGPAEQLSGVEPGLVLLLHDGEPEADALELEWREVCRRHQLILAVVYHDYSIPLDSVDVLGEVLSQLLRMGRPDFDRVALVTGESHAGLVTRVLLDPRLRVLRQAVFRDCRPITGGASLGVLQQKDVSILLFPATGDSQVDALTASSVRRMRTAGAAVTVRRDAEELSGPRLANEIARWMLLQKIR